MVAWIRLSQALQIQSAYDWLPEPTVGVRARLGRETNQIAVLAFPASVWAAFASWAASCVVRVCSVFQPFLVAAAGRAIFAELKIHHYEFQTTTTKLGICSS